jgi:hypothetical protein
MRSFPLTKLRFSAVETAAPIPHSLNATILFHRVIPGANPTAVIA